MPWILLLIAVAAFAVAFITTSIPLAVFALLAALVLLVLGVLGLLTQRIGSRSRDESLMVDPNELRRLRELAEAQRASRMSDSSRPGQSIAP